LLFIFRGKQRQRFFARLVSAALPVAYKNTVFAENNPKCKNDEKTGTVLVPPVFS